MNVNFLFLLLLLFFIWFYFFYLPITPKDLYFVWWRGSQCRWYKETVYFLPWNNKRHNKTLKQKARTTKKLNQTFLFLQILKSSSLTLNCGDLASSCTDSLFADCKHYSTLENLYFHSLWEWVEGIFYT